MRLLAETLRDLWRLLDRRGRRLAVLLVLALIVSGSFELVSIIFLFGYIEALADAGGSRNPAVQFYQAVASGFDGMAFAAVAGAAMVLVFALKNIVGLLTSFFLMRFAMKRYQQIATRLFEGFLHVRLETFNQRGTMAPQQILTSVVHVFRGSFNPALETLSDIAIMVTMLAALLFVLDPWLVLVAGTVLCSGGVAFLALTRRMSTELGARRVEAERALMQTMLDAFRGLIDTRLGNRQGAVVARYARVAGDFALSDRRARALDMTPRALNEMLLAAGIVLAAIWFANTPGGLRDALPALAVMGFAGLRMTAAMSRLAGALQHMRESDQLRRSMMEAVGESAPALLLSGSSRGSEDYLAEDRPLPKGVSRRLTEAITIEDVAFCYPGSEAPAFSDISLAIPKGGFVALCGPSGSGKSTLALAIMGLIRPQSGRILCDGWDIFRHLRTWHDNIGYVGQSPFIAPRSVRENVAFGFEREEIDDARVWRALEAAVLADVIGARPEGLDSMVGEEGVRLSGGQRQRLSIARALYRDPEVLVFDEATAALDTVTEKEVSAAILAMSGAKTVICIAHRLTTIRDADVIHYMEDGRIVASGTYRQLEQHCAAFRRMAQGTGKAA